MNSVCQFFAENNDTYERLYVVYVYIYIIGRLAIFRNAKPGRLLQTAIMTR